LVNLKTPTRGFSAALKNDTRTKAAGMTNAAKLALFIFPPEYNPSYVAFTARFYSTPARGSQNAGGAEASPNL
jgi:hypothetical protein